MNGKQAAERWAGFYKSLVGIVGAIVAIVVIGLAALVWDTQQKAIETLATKLDAHIEAYQLLRERVVRLEVQRRQFPAVPSDPYFQREK